MLPDLTPTEWLSVGSFSIALAALLLRSFISAPTAREHLSTAILVLASIAIGINTIQSAQRARTIHRLGEQIVTLLGNQEKTEAQLLADLSRPDVHFAAAMAWLEAEGRIEGRPETVSLTKHQDVRIRLWRARAVSRRD